MHDSLKGLTSDKVIEQRIKIINFYKRYGGQATLDAFGVSRKLNHQWLQRLKLGGGQDSALCPTSTRPQRLRSPHPVSLDVIAFIKELRNKYSIGKVKIKPLLDKYCQANSIRTVSASTIGNIIKRCDIVKGRHTNKRYHDPASGWATRNKRHKGRLRTKHPIKPSYCGHIVSDTVEILDNGVKHYFFNAIDAKSKFALSLHYRRNSSANMRDFFCKFKRVYPCEIKSWQSDNGAENLGKFVSTLQQAGIPHYFSYPRCPKINTFIERYNRTLKEEFLYNHWDALEDKDTMNRELGEYLVFYNTERVHNSLRNIPPINYMIKQQHLSHMCVADTPNVAAKSKCLHICQGKMSCLQDGGFGVFVNLFSYSYFSSAVSL